MTPGSGLHQCPVCRAAVESTFLVCPVCTTRLKQACVKCNAPLEALWQICPHCATPVSTPNLPGIVEDNGRQRLAGGHLLPVFRHDQQGIGAGHTGENA